MASFLHFWEVIKGDALQIFWEFCGNPIVEVEQTNVLIKNRVTLLSFNESRLTLGCGIYM